MTEFGRPPRGWLKGVLVTILIFWAPGTTWSAFRNHEISALKFAGAVIIVLSSVIVAQQALTNDGYKTSKWTIVGQRCLLVGVVLFIVGSHF